MILIPAYEPAPILIEIISELNRLLFEIREYCPIVVVNDGSTNKLALKVLTTIKERNVVIIHHDKNLGKGAALKTGIDYANANAIEWILTADADGQHLPSDIIKIIKEGRKSNNEYILGIREFDNTTPLRSRLGNTLTRHLFKFAHGEYVQDTQTGLRFIPRSHFEKLENIPYNHYEFEFASLIQVVKDGNIRQIPIQTVYEPGNPTSHFRKFVDSARIYYVFARSIVTSIICTIIDLSVFLLVLKIFDNTLVSILAARSIATLVYFYLARNFVFQTKERALKQFVLYSSLVLLNALILSPIIDMIYAASNTAKGFTYLMGSMALYLVNLSIQKYFIFNDKEGYTP